MEDTKTEVLEQYAFQVNNSFRGRDARILDTDQGLLSLREYGGSERKLTFQDSLLTYLEKEGFLADFIVKNKEGALFSRDREERRFVVRVWYEGKECSLRDETQIRKAVECLARFHLACRKVPFPEEVEAGAFGQNVYEILERHNREMRKTRAYVRERRGKTDFEAAFLQCFPEFYEKGVRAVEALEQSSYGQLYGQAVREQRICHGSFHQHHVLFWAGKTVLLQFDRCHVGVQLSDLYDFMRKVMEKWDWNPRLGLRMIRWYDAVAPLSEQEWEYVRLRLSYPEKFWKITNHYYNSRKSWIPDRTKEKLEILLGQEKKKEAFLRQFL